MPPQSHRRQLKNYLLDRKYQLRYTLIMVVLSSLLTAGLGYFWYQESRATSRAIEIYKLTTLGDEDVQQVQEQMADRDRIRLLVLVGFGVLFAFAMAGYGIVLTHRVAGPLYKISRYMGEVRDGKLGPVYDLRRGDQLHDFFEGFKQMHSALRERAEAEAQTLTEMIAAGERHLAQVGPQNAGDLPRQLDLIRELRDRIGESLKAS